MQWACAVVPLPRPRSSPDPPDALAGLLAQGYDYTVIPRIDKLFCDVWGGPGRLVYNVSPLHSKRASQVQIGMGPGLEAMHPPGIPCALTHVLRLSLTMHFPARLVM